MFTEQDNLAITRTELDEVFFQNLEMRGSFPGHASAENGKLFRVVNTTHSSYIGEINKSSGLWSQIGETTTVPEGTPRVANKYTISVSDFAQEITLSKNLFDDNMHDVWAEDVRRFALMARTTQDFTAFALFRNAFTTTLTADGIALISASHVTLSGVTVSNIIASSPLSTTGLNSAIVKLGEMKTQEGVIMGAVGTDMSLLVPLALFKLAVEITDSVLVSDTANNAVNVYRSMFGIEVMTSPYLGAAAGGSDTAWFLLSPMHSVKRLIRQGVQTALTSWEYSNNRTYRYQGNYRENYYVSDYFGVVGATGL